MKKIERILKEQTEKERLEQAQRNIGETPSIRQMELYWKNEERLFELKEEYEKT